MWHSIGADDASIAKWVKVNDANRITARIHLKDGEYKTSKLNFDANDLGVKQYLGSFLTLEAAKTAAEANVTITPIPGV